MDSSLGAAAALRVWELGRHRHSIDRALLLIAAADPETPPDVLAELTVGQRDARLLELREAMFGPSAHAAAECPACHVFVEFAIDDLRAGAITNAENVDSVERFSAEAHGYRVELRALNSRDLSEAARCSDIEAARTVLGRRAVVAAELGGESISPAELPDTVVDDIGRLLGENDSAADMTIEVVCQECWHRWEEPLDPSNFLWTEIDAFARRLIQQVHALALAYGWTEAQTLALTPERRRAYLDLVGSG